MQVTVAELIAQYLQRLGIEVIFGMPGAHVLPLYDALFRSPVRSVLAKHEQGAAFMAGGRARHRRVPAACIATAGPGATNLITGIANAYAEGLPVLAITGETSTYIFGRGGLQESAGEGGAVDQVALFRGITRYAKLIERTDYLAQVLAQATQALFAETPGPVLLSIPYNVQKEPVDDGLLEALYFPRRRAPRTGLSKSLDDAVSLFAAARQPVIIAGFGCIQAEARDALARFSEDYAVPVTTSLKAKGAINEGAALSLGCLGVTSNGEARRYIETQADLLIFLGASFNERTSYLWNPALLADRHIVQVDINPGQLGKVFQPDVAIQGDIKAMLEDLLHGLQQRAVKPKNLQAFEQHQSNLSSAPSAMSGDVGQAPSRFALIAHFYASLARSFPDGAIVFDDNIVFAQSYFSVSDRNHYYPNSGISSLGHALPAALGAGLGEGKGPVFAILGDGGFQMCAMELMTAVNYQTPINVLVINNGTMGLIRKNQFQLYDQRYIDCDFVNPDFAMLATSFGIQHHRLETPDDVDELFANADLRGAINLIELMLDKDAFPTYLSAR